MTTPNAYLPGAFVEVARRCTQREFKLTPDYLSDEQRRAYAEAGKPPSTIAQIYQYVTARLAERYGIAVIATCLMGNHMHEILYDRDGRIAAFLGHRNKLLAEVVKVRHGLADALFERKNITYNRLLNADSVARKIAYVLANPVTAGLVRAPEEWPGYVSAVAQLDGRGVTVKRPVEYLSQNNKTHPPTVSFRHEVPDELLRAFGTLSALQARVAEHLAEHLAKARRRHARFGTAAAIRATRPTERPRGPVPRAARRPRFTAGDPATLRAAYKEHRRFVAAYRDAFREARAGKRPVFPPGTWKMHAIFGHRRRDIGGRGLGVAAKA